MIEGATLAFFRIIGFLAGSWFINPDYIVYTWR